MAKVDKIENNEAVVDKKVDKKSRKRSYQLLAFSSFKLKNCKNG